MNRSTFESAPVRAGVLLFACLSTLSARASDGPEEPYELTPILVVTPGRGEQPLDTVLDAMSVIGRYEIEQSAAEDLLELLRLLPGIDIVRTGPAGAQTSVFLRGTNSNHVLVLIDGIRVSSTNTGAYAWEQLPVNQIERIEIVRGPKGGVYGSDAIGGVIQVFTRSDPEPYLRLTGGSWSTREAEGGWGFESGATRLSLNGGYRKTDGFSAQNPSGFSFDPDDDGLESANLGINAAHRLNRGALHFSLLLADTDSDFDQGVSDGQQSLASLRYEGEFHSAWRYQLIAGYARDRLFTDFGGFRTKFLSERFDFAWQHEVSLADASTLRFGADYTRDSGADRDSFDENRRNAGLYAGIDHGVGRWLLQASGRVDDNSEFGTEFTGQLGAGFELSERWRVGASWGSGFRAPNLNQQFSPGFGGMFAGNPALEPEESRSAEVNLRWSSGTAGFRVSAYHTTVDDLIAFTGPDFSAVNVAEAELEGVELEYHLNRGPWSLAATATFQRAEDDMTGEPLPRRPDRKGSLTLDRRLGRSSWIGLEWFLSASRPDIGGVILPGYELLNLRAGWQVGSAWRIELRADNLLDKTYEPAFGFNGAERSVFVSVAWMP